MNSESVYTIKYPFTYFLKISRKIYDICILMQKYLVHFFIVYFVLAFGVYIVMIFFKYYADFSKCLKLLRRFSILCLLAKTS